MSANVETMFYTREKPWHGMGTMVQEAPTSAEALKLAGLDWIVEPKPIYTQTETIFGTTMEEVKGYVANTRSSDGSVLGIVTGAYKIIQNVDAFAFTDSLIGGEVRYETAGSLAGGRRVWLLARLSETEILGDKTEQYLVFSNTFDGSGAVRVACTPVRVVCQNTLNCALSTAKRSWSIRHTVNINYRLQEAHEALQLAGKYINALNVKAEDMAGYRLSSSALESLVKQLFPITDDATQIVKNHAEEKRAMFRTALQADDLANFRGTAWQFINAASDMAGHAQPIRQTATGRENRLKNIFEGHPILDRAYALVEARM